MSNQAPGFSAYPRYFVRSRHLAAKVAGGRVNIAFREMGAAEAEPHIKSVEKREAKYREWCAFVGLPVSSSDTSK